MRTEFIRVPIVEEVRDDRVIRRASFPKPAGYVGSAGFDVGDGTMIRKVLASDDAMDEILAHPDVTLLNVTMARGVAQNLDRITTNDLNGSFKINGL